MPRNILDWLFKIAPAAMNEMNDYCSNKFCPTQRQMSRQSCWESHGDRLPWCLSPHYKSAFAMHRWQRHNLPRRSIMPSLSHRWALPMRRDICAYLQVFCTSSILGFQLRWHAIWNMRLGLFLKARQWRMDKDDIWRPTTSVVLMRHIRSCWTLDFVDMSSHSQHSKDVGMMDFKMKAN